MKLGRSWSECRGLRIGCLDSFGVNIGINLLVRLEVKLLVGPGLLEPESEEVLSKELCKRFDARELEDFVRFVRLELVEVDFVILVDFGDGGDNAFAKLSTSARENASLEVSDLNGHSKGLSIDGGSDRVGEDGDSGHWLSAGDSITEGTFLRFSLFFDSRFRSWMIELFEDGRVICIRWTALEFLVLSL